MQLEEIRRDYKHAKLDENNILSNPIHQFSKWMNEALNANLKDATAMSLVSMGTNGFPQSRIVLLKDFGENGFTFFTNYNSEKGQSIKKDNRVSLHFFWSELERQIRISGLATKTDNKTSERYFHTRPQKSQIAAAVSAQSSVIPSRKFLETKYNELAEKLHGEHPELPMYWGGYVVQPVLFEFWQGRDSRLHDRITYKKQAENWEIKRLAP